MNYIVSSYLFFALGIIGLIIIIFALRSEIALFFKEVRSRLFLKKEDIKRIRRWFSLKGSKELLVKRAKEMADAIAEFCT